jgi:hypothetical protein
MVTRMYLTMESFQALYHDCSTFGWSGQGMYMYKKKETFDDYSPGGINMKGSQPVKWSARHYVPDMGLRSHIMQQLPHRLYLGLVTEWQKAREDIKMQVARTTGLSAAWPRW